MAQFISKNTGPAKPSLRLPGPGLANANTKGGSVKIVKPNSGPAKVLPKR
jgi:hypothetical protein